MPLVTQKTTLPQVYKTQASFVKKIDIPVPDFGVDWPICDSLYLAAP
jgi:hypothetical protein